MNASSPTTDSRSSERLPAGSNVWLHCRRAGPLPGPDIANGLLDLSAGGVQLLARALLRPGEAVEITLGGSGIRGSILRRGEVRWVVELGDTACCAGIRFDEPISAADAVTLTAAPAPTDDAAIPD